MAARVSIGFLLFVFSVVAQSSQAKIEGRIVPEHGTVEGDFSAELYHPAGTLRTVGKAVVSRGGQFSFEQIPASATYLVRVKSSSGSIIGEQIVNPESGQGTVQVKVGAARNAPAPGNTISLMELSHKVPGPALKEAREADKALKKKDFSALIAHLEKVVAIDPDFIMAHRNLSLAYLKTYQYQKAIDAFEKLARLEPHAALPYAGLSAAYFNLHRFVESEAAARMAVNIDPSYELGHFLLGSTLAAQDKDDEQALRHLTRAVGHFPVAYITLAGILARHGDSKGAKQQIQAYFDSGETASRTDAEDLLIMLGDSPNPSQAATR